MKEGLDEDLIARIARILKKGKRIKFTDEAEKLILQADKFREKADRSFVKARALYRKSDQLYKDAERLQDLASKPRIRGDD